MRKLFGMEIIVEGRMEHKECKTVERSEEIRKNIEQNLAELQEQ